MSKIPTDLVRHALNGPTMGPAGGAIYAAPRLTLTDPRLLLPESVDTVGPPDVNGNLTAT